LPLYHHGTTETRLIGVLAPLTTASWIGTQPVQSLSLGIWRQVGPQIDQAIVPRFVDVPPESRVHQGLVVHDGGRS
jgi:hypothetical protein